MPILDYSQWFGEATNDPHGAGFGSVLNTYRSDADNAAALADLNTTWAEDEDLNPLLGIDAADGHHYVVFAAGKVPRSAGGHASTYAGQIIAQYGDVGEGVTGLRFVSVGNHAFSRMATAAAPVFVPTAGHIDALIGADADNADLLVPGAAAADADHTAVTARALIPIPYHAAPLVLAQPMKPKELWQTLGGYLRGHADAATFEPIIDFLRLTMTHVDGDDTTSRTARAAPALVRMDGPLDRQRTAILKEHLPDRFDPVRVATLNQSGLVAAANTFTQVTTQALAQQTQMYHASQTSTPKKKFGSVFPRLLLLTAKADEQELATEVPVWNDLAASAKGFETSTIRTAVQAVCAKFGLEEPVITPIVLKAFTGVEFHPSTVSTLLEEHTLFSVVPSTTSIDPNTFRLLRACEEAGRSSQLTVEWSMKLQDKLMNKFFVGVDGILLALACVEGFAAIELVRLGETNPLALELVNTLLPALRRKRGWFQGQVARDPYAMTRIMGMIHNKVYRYMARRNRLQVVPGTAPPAYNNLPDLAEYIDEIEGLEVAWESWRIPDAYLEKNPVLDEEGKGGPKLRKGTDDTTQEEGRPFSKRPEDKTYVIGKDFDIAAAISEHGPPPKGKNGQTCLAYHGKGLCPSGDKCLRVRDHCRTHPDDVAARKAYFDKCRGASA